jgi:uncharacterized membrane protein required for colicin V production
MYIDVGFIAILVLFGFIGFFRGFLVQLVSLVAAVVALLLTMYVQEPVSEFAFKWLTARFSELDLDFQIVQFGCGVLLFSVTYILCGAVLDIVRKLLVRSDMIRNSDRLMGFLAGLLKAVVIILLLVLVAEWSKGYLKRQLAEGWYLHYQESLSESEVYAGGLYTLNVTRDRWPWFSNITAKVELGLPVDDEVESEQAPESTGHADQLG